MSRYRLCLVKYYQGFGVMFFTDNFDGQSGSDWDDYVDYAGDPYEYSDSERGYPPVEECGNIRRIGFYIPGNKYINYGAIPCNAGILKITVNDVNRGRVCWLYADEGVLKGGATLEEARRWLKKVRAVYGELKRR